MKLNEERQKLSASNQAPDALPNLADVELIGDCDGYLPGEANASQPKFHTQRLLAVPPKSRKMIRAAAENVGSAFVLRTALAVYMPCESKSVIDFGDNADC